MRNWITSTKTVYRGALENPLSGCRRCKASIGLPNLSGKRTEAENTNVRRIPAILIFRATDFIGDFFILLIIFMKRKEKTSWTSLWMVSTML